MVEGNKPSSVGFAVIHESWLQLYLMSYNDSLMVSPVTCNCCSKAKRNEYAIMSCKFSISLHACIPLYV